MEADAPPPREARGGAGADSATPPAEGEAGARPKKNKKGVKPNKKHYFC
jgi:hypothetical protein